MALSSFDTGDDAGTKKKKSGPSLSQRAESASSGLSGLASSGPSAGSLASFKRGGKVKKTGPAKLHKGERVLTKKEAKRYKKRSRRK